MRVSEGYLEQRKAQIAAVAMRLYCDEGPHVPVSRICAEAGIAKGTIFNYFPTRDAMFLEIFDACRSHALEMARSSDVACDTDEETLYRAILRSFAWPLGSPDEFRFVTMYADSNAFYASDPERFGRLTFDTLVGEGAAAFDRLRDPGIAPELAERMLSALVNTTSRMLISRVGTAAGSVGNRDSTCPASRTCSSDPDAGGLAAIAWTICRALVPGWEGRACFTR